MSPVDTSTLRLERTYEASAEEVFDAWTNPEVLRRWWAVTPEQSTPVADVDLRVGGVYRLAMENPDGTRHTVGGEYVEVSRPRRLVYTWAWESEDGGEAGADVSMVTVEFAEDAGRTTVVLEHSQLASAESAERHEHGWNACLQMLAERVFTA
jgi:uncharacterized protein YndB with AHSA1/START domain